MMSDIDNLDVMLRNENTNPIGTELVDAFEQSSAHKDAETNMYHGDEYRNLTNENVSLRQNDVRQSFEAFFNEFNLGLSQEMDSMMSMMHSQINRAISTAIAKRVIPEIQDIATSLSSIGNKDTEASMSPNCRKTGKMHLGLK